MEQKNNFFIIGITLVATLGGLLFGYDTAVISGTVKHLQAFFIDPLVNNPEQAMSVILQFKITIVVVVAIIGYAIGAILVKLFGKARGFSMSAVLAIIAVIVLYRFVNQSNEIGEAIANSIKGFTISSALVGCIIGGSTGGFISRQLGRKNGLLLAAVLFTISAIGSAAPERMNIFGVHTIVSFIIYRIIGGVGVGLASMLAPMYIAEISPAKIRGKLVSWNQFAIIFGMLVIYFVNYFIANNRADEWLNNTGWRYMFASETIPAGLFLILLFFVPESPRYLVMAAKEDAALKVLKKLNGETLAGKILNDIKDTLHDKSKPWLSFGGLVIMIGIFLSVFQQFVGINVVLYYAPEIFRTLGETTDVALLQTIIVGIINLSFTVVAILTVDKLGRKPLMIIGAVGMAIAMFGLGMFFYSESMGLGALIFMLIYVASFAVSWGPVVWVLLSEIFPNAIRGAMSIAVTAQWIANLIVSWTFPMMNDSSWLTDKFHNGFAYWIYCVMAVIAAIFMWKVVPETKGKTLEEMEKLWKR